jgi:hypothetical protein
VGGGEGSISVGGPGRGQCAPRAQTTLTTLHDHEVAFKIHFQIYLLLYILFFIFFYKARFSLRSSLKLKAQVINLIDVDVR